MKKFELCRSYLSDRTVGIFKHKEFKLRSLERIWNNTKVNESCIPEGAYLVKRDKYGKHQFYAVQDVEGRTAIEFHGGYYPYNSNGCILLGLAHTESYNLGMSERALDSLVDYAGDESFLLHIRAAKAEDWL